MSNSATARRPTGCFELSPPTALEHDATVLHYDHDFDLIAEVTGLAGRWIIPPGTGHGQAGT